jgi:cobalt-zinc-cadmium efflux system membrane fusion protein
MTAKVLLLRLLAPLFGGTLMASFAVAEGPMKGPDFLRVVPDQMHQLEIVKVGTYAFRAQTSAIGQIGYNEDASTIVLTPFSGRVTRLIARLGDQVKRGDPLLEIDSPEERLHRGTGCKTQGGLPAQFGADPREARSRSA